MLVYRRVSQTSNQTIWWTRAHEKCSAEGSPTLWVFCCYMSHKMLASGSMKTTSRWIHETAGFPDRTSHSTLWGMLKWPWFWGPVVWWWCHYYSFITIATLLRKKKRRKVRKVLDFLSTLRQLSSITFYNIAGQILPLSWSSSNLFKGSYRWSLLSKPRDPAMSVLGWCFHRPGEHHPS